MKHTGNRELIIPGDSFEVDLKPSLDFGRLFGVLRRNIRLIVFMGMVGLALAFIHVSLTPAKYSATSTLFIDSRKVRTLQNAYVFNEDDRSIDIDLGSQIQVLQSGEIAARIVNKLNLADARPTKEHKGWTRELFAALDWKKHLSELVGEENVPDFLSWREPKPVDAETRRLDAIDKVRRGLSIDHLRGSTILEISYTSTDPELAAKVTNAVAEAYIENQRLLQKQAASSATEWLDDRLADLKQTIEEKEERIQEFKKKNKMISAEGGLVEEKRLSEANRQLMAARTELAEREARYQQLQSALEGHSGDGVSSAFYADPFINQLRSRYIALVSNENAFVERLGENHEAIKRLREQKEEYERLMQSELKRLAESARSDLDLAQVQVEKLEDRYTEIAKESAEANRLQSDLQSFERTFNSYQKFYDDVLEQHQAALQQQSFNNRNARVITAAQVPDKPNGPGMLQKLLFAFIVGAGFGGAIGCAREFADQSFRSRRQVRGELRQDSVWVLPVPNPPRPKWRWKANNDAERVTRPSHETLRGALDDPVSHFAETLEAIKLHIDLSNPGRKTRYIGVVSVLPGEGRTVVAQALGALIAKTGSRALLIDGDMKNTQLTKLLAPDAREGLVEAAKNGDPLENRLYTQLDSGLRFLPAVNDGSVCYTGDFLSSAATETLFSHASEAFDYVLMDLPAMGLHTDVRAVAERLDTIVLVVAWGKTPRDLVKEALEEVRPVADKCRGVVLTLSDLRELKTYEPDDVVRCFRRKLRA